MFDEITAIATLTSDKAVIELNKQDVTKGLILYGLDIHGQPNRPVLSERENGCQECLIYLSRCYCDLKKGA
jgi:hypothetical protein